MKKFLLGMLISILLFACSNAKKASQTSQTQTPAASNKKPASELLDVSAGESVKKSFEAFAKGDVDGMVAEFDDNIRYVWSGGDSLVGKEAVADYYKGRWNLIESLSITEPIVLPVQVNETKSKYAPTGKWVLYWGMVDVKYKNGKNLNFWMHNVNHYNNAGKIDFIGQYIDRHPIIEATSDLDKK